MISDILFPSLVNEEQTQPEHLESMAAGTPAGGQQLRKRGLRRPQHRRDAPAEVEKEVVTDETTGVSYVATGSTPGEKKKAKVKFTWSAWWEHTVQSFFQAISLAIFIVCSMIILWYLSQTRLFQQSARETGLLHGAVSWVKNNPSEEAAVPYMTNPFLWHWVMENPKNQRILVEEGGVLPMLKLVHEDKNSVLTRLSLAVLREAVEAVDVMDKRSVALTAQTMTAYLRKNINRAFHRRGEETAASTLAHLVVHSRNSAELAHLGALDELRHVKKWLKVADIVEELEAALNPKFGTPPEATSAM